MPQMRQSQKPARLWEFLRQDFEKELDLPGKVKRLAQLYDHYRPPLIGGRMISWVIFSFLFLCLSSLSCKHAPDLSPELEGAIQIIEANEKIVLKAIAQVLKDRGFGDPRVGADKGQLETDYVVQGNWRTKVVATVKGISKKESEVKLLVLTEKKSFSGWHAKRLLEKEQYNKLFQEIEMQVYREWSKPK